MTQETALTALVCPSPTNPRKTYGGPEDDALAENIKIHGIFTPLLVRPWDANLPWPEDRECMPVYEIVAGERRYRGALAAGLERVPVVVRPLTDKQVAEIQMIENLQRKGLGPLEEAEGYSRMMEEHGYTADQLAEQISKSRSYIYGRIKLATICAKGREALRDGRLEESVALMLARIPGVSLQEKALGEVLSNIYTLQPMTHREASRHIQERYTLHLGKAPFPTGDSTLVPAAGRCYACPKRSGNAQALYPDIENPEICTDPGCFADKKAAHIARQKAEAEAAGKQVIDGEAAAKLITGQHGIKGHVKLDDKAYDISHSAREGEVKTYRELLADAAGDLETVLIENASKGEMIEAIPAKAMAQALEKVGLKPSSAPQFDRQKEEEKKAREETEWRQHLHGLIRANRIRSLRIQAPLELDELAMATLVFWKALWFDHQSILAKIWHRPEEKLDHHERVYAFSDRIPTLSHAELSLLQLDMAMAWELKCNTYSTTQPINLLAQAERESIDVKTAKTAFEVGKEAKKAGKTAKPKENEMKNTEESAPKTKKLGVLPNKHGVYTCEPDEINKWSSKNDYAEIELLELENGIWLHAINTRDSQGGFSSPLTLRHGKTESREEALLATRETLERLFNHLKGAALNSFKLWISGLTPTAESISTPPTAARAREGVAPETKAAQAGGENTQAKGETLGADAPEVMDEKSPGDEGLSFVVGDRVVISKKAKCWRAHGCTGTITAEPRKGVFVFTYTDKEGKNGVGSADKIHLTKIDDVSDDTTPQSPATAGEEVTDAKLPKTKRQPPTPAPMYAHPVTKHLCWSGRGRQPKWVEQWLAVEGNTLEMLKPAQAGKRQQSQASRACAEDAAGRCDKTVDMFQEVAA